MWLVISKEMNSCYTKHVKTLCGQNIGYFSVKHGGPNRNQRCSKD